eukprot:UN09361
MYKSIKRNLFITLTKFLPAPASFSIATLYTQC